MTENGQLDLNDLSPQALLEDELERRRLVAYQAADQAWALIAAAAEEALTLPGLSADAARPVRDLLVAATAAAGLPPAQLVALDPLPALQAG